ncbi:7762_t:CDS:2 [Paraglomus brasilianum]|uniref:7762_t:CDS:1 n=1 Tax=Paraglomus brasilianum TaxID=144538 RepID=A0A9N8Z1M5_9GLOM|nr:7762_t:CDS:2 [Paraglomus brasilianum]
MLSRERRRINKELLAHANLNVSIKDGKIIEVGTAVCKIELRL